MSKEIENQPRLKKLNLKSNLTCNIYNSLYLRYWVQFWALLIQSKGLVKILKVHMGHEAHMAIAYPSFCGMKD